MNLSTFKTYAALGVGNIAMVAAYRLQLKAGVHAVQKLPLETVAGPFYRTPEKLRAIQPSARGDWKDGEGSFFGVAQPLSSEPPDWKRSCQNHDIRWASEKNWWEIGDFESGLGDVKAVWEASRFDWVVAMSQRAAIGDETELERLNVWLEDWVTKNPAYRGVNWKCGQETSIRVMNLMTGLLCLDQWQNPESGFLQLVKLHLARVAPTMNYAIGQANNHGTSEAAALFMGGALLARSGDKSAKVWLETGRKWLENRAQNLIESDGTFSQYSVTYHRLMLDTYSLVEVWRQRLELPPFSKQLYDRMRAALLWLRQMTDLISGDAANMGANDGAHILVLTDDGYRDFRPSLELASTLFENASAFPEPGNHDQQLTWLGLEKPVTTLPELVSHTFDGGGFHVLRNDRAKAILRFPNFKFRPGQADALHLDFWLDGKNFFRDAGTFSYNVDDQTSALYSGVQGHNTIQFDDHDQMPRIGRFLYNDWLTSDSVLNVKAESNVQSASAAYRDKWGCHHFRRLALGQNRLEIEDIISGFQSKATFRLRLMPGNWDLSDQVLSLNGLSIEFQSDKDITDMKLTSGQESRFYLETTSVPLLEFTLNQPSKLKMTVSL